MKYRVIHPFKDKLDKGKGYTIGDPYPKGSFKPTKKRYEELLKVNTTYNTAFIEKVEEPNERKEEEVERKEEEKREPSPQE